MLSNKTMAKRINNFSALWSRGSILFWLYMEFRARQRDIRIRENAGYYERRTTEVPVLKHDVKVVFPDLLILSALHSD